MNIRPGDSFKFRRKVTSELINRFADVSGDKNPIHLDEEFAKQSRFKKRIAHGMLTASFISAVIGTEFVSSKIVYLGQTLSFRNPVFIGDEVTAIAVVKEIREDKPVITLETRCENQHGELLIEGEAAIMLLD